MVVSPLALHQMYHKFVGITTVEFGEATRKQSLHVLDSVHMVFPSCEFVFTMENPVVVVAVENQAVISLPAVRMNRRAFKHKASVL